MSSIAVFVLLAASVAATDTEDPPEYQQGAACYGFGGGHGVWKCGTSAAWCTKIGGVARYVEGYTSSRSGMCMCSTGCPSEDKIQAGFTKGDSYDGYACVMGSTTQCGVAPSECVTEGSGESPSKAPGTMVDGCCLCEENCDHSLETGTDCEGTYTTAVPSPSPPPSPPSPPPSPSYPPAVGDAGGIVVTMQMTVSGDMDSYPDSKKALIATAIGLMVAVHPDDITVSFTAGSVIITVEIKCPDQDAVDKVTSTIEEAMPDADSATSALGGKYGGILPRGGSVEETPTVTVASGLSTGVLIGIIAGVVVLLLIVVVVYMKMKKNKKGAAPPAKGAAV
jgi:hypothetical protein